MKSPGSWAKSHWRAVALALVFLATAIIALLTSAQLSDADPLSNWLWSTTSAWWSNTLANVGVAMLLAVPVTVLGIIFSGRIDKAEGEATTATQTARIAGEKADDAQKSAATATQQAEKALSYAEALADLKAEQQERRTSKDAVYERATEMSVPALYDALQEAQNEGILRADGIRIPVIEQNRADAGPESRWYLRFSVRDEQLTVSLSQPTYDAPIGSYPRDGAIRDLLADAQARLQEKNLVVPIDGDDIEASHTVERLVDFFAEVATLRKSPDPEQRKLFAQILLVEDFSDQKTAERETWYFTDTRAIPIAKPELSFQPGTHLYAMPVDRRVQWRSDMEDKGLSRAGAALGIADALGMGKAGKKSL